MFVLALGVSLAAKESFCMDQAGSPGNGERYNVILLTVNVLRADHVSSYGYVRKTTPAIDELAKTSYVFKNAFAQAGYTFPNMISLLTSTYPDSHKVYFAFKDKLSAKVKTLPELFKIFGYQTAWFAVLQEPHLALDAGFERGFDFKGNIDTELKGGEGIPEWIRNHKEKPFFIALNTRHTHGPYFPLKSYRKIFNTGKKGQLIENYDELERKTYAIIVEGIKQSDPGVTELFDEEILKNNKEIFNGSYDAEKFAQLENLIIPEKRHKMGHLMMQTYNNSVDQNDKENLDYLVSLYDACILGTDQEIVKPIIETLKKEMLFDKTLLIVTADHGEAHGEHGIIGHGLQFYDQLIHVPLVIKMPGQSNTKELTDMVQSIDIMPTILDVAGLEKPYNLQGRSLLPVIRGQAENSPREDVYGENYEVGYVRSLKWKLIVNREEFRKKSGMHDMLFNLADDPAELKNVVDEFPVVYKELQEKLQKHFDSLPDFTDQKYEFAPNIDSVTQERIKKTGYW